VNHGTLIVDHSTIQFSQTDISHSGGGIFSDGPLFITNSTLNHNQAGSAGALFADTASARVQINNSTISNNQAIDSVDGVGGAIWVDQQAQLSMDNLYLSNNHSRLGGALYISPGSAVTVTGAAPSPNFQLNSASDSGGAIYNQAGGSLTTVATLLTQNHVPTNTLSAGSGGAIFSAGPLSLHETYFLFNDARYGGGLLIDAAGTPSSIVLEHSSFVGNYALVSGGGLWADASGGSSTGGAVQVLDSTFAANHLQNLGKGGAIINTARLVCSFRDQRGALRPDACDKGAVEFGGLLPRVFAPFIRK